MPRGKAKPAEPLKNTADDDDYRQALEEIEEIDSEADGAKEEHRKNLATIRERKKRKIKMLCADLGIDRDVFEAMLADRKEDRSYKASKADRARKIPEAKVELYLDALGQFSWIAPDDEPSGKPSETVAERAARERAEAISKVTEEEQSEGAAVLDEMAGLGLH